MKRKTLRSETQEADLRVVDDIIAIASKIDATTSFTTDDFVQLERSLDLDPSARLPVGISRHGGCLRLDMLAQNLPKIREIVSSTRRAASPRFANTSDTDILDQATWLPVELFEDGDRLLMQFSKLSSRAAAPREVKLSINGLDLPCEMLDQEADQEHFILALPVCTVRKISLVENDKDVLLVKLFS